MHENDVINGAFELTGSIVIWTNVWRLMVDKHVAGINWWATVFWSAWGWWNVYYYPTLEQWCSFAGGIVLAVGNTTWVIIYLWQRAKN